jgi:hypothetical protein
LQRVHILRLFKSINFDELQWIELAQERDRWRGCCACGNEPSVSIKCREFLD